MEMIKTVDLHKSFGDLHVLKDIDLTVKAGEKVVIIGPSGSGKSTLLNILGILDNYDSGEYRLAGTLIKDLSETRAAEYRNRMIGFIFQSFNLEPDAPMMDTNSPLAMSRFIPFSGVANETNKIVHIKDGLIGSIEENLDHKASPFGINGIMK